MGILDSSLSGAGTMGSVGGRGGSHDGGMEEGGKRDGEDL
jgi:hypothetical protein